MTRRIITSPIGPARWAVVTALEVDGLVLDVGAATDRGTARDINEDGFAIGPATVAVLDGSVGGLDGATARRRALEIALRMPHDDAAAVLRAVDAAMVRTADPADDGPRTSATAAAVSFAGSDVVVAHIGDCRVLRCRAGIAAALTRDHTLRTLLLDQGREVPADFAHEGVITRALGMTLDASAEIERAIVSFERGDRLILCSDGVHGSLDAARLAILCVVDDLQRAAETILDAAMAAGSKDNLTVAIVAR